MVTRAESDAGIGAGGDESERVEKAPSTGKVENACNF